MLIEKVANLLCSPFLLSISINLVLFCLSLMRFVYKRMEIRWKEEIKKNNNRIRY